MHKKSPHFCFLIIFIFSLLSSPSFSKEASSINSGFADIVENLLPAVVNISTTQKPKEDVDKIISKLPEDKVFDHLKNALKKESSKQKNASSLGSGFIISKDGYIVTKNHVIENAAEITINLNDGKKIPAKIIGVDKKTDTALLKIESTSDLPFVKFADSSKSRIGDWVIVIGNPYGLGGSVSVGIISAKGRDLIETQGDFIQTDAAINRGNSGGPLFDMNGEVVGVATAIFSTSGGGNIGIGFATTSNSSLPIINQLKSQGKVFRGWIGISMQEVTKEVVEAIGMENQKGIIVTQVNDKGAAKLAGVLPSDIIVKFDGQNIEDMKMMQKIVSDTEIGKKVSIVVIREGKKKTLNATIKQMPDDLEEDEKEDQKTKATTHILGLGVIDLNKEISKEYGVDNENGVLITNVKTGSKLAESGVLAGDIILSVNQKPIKSVKYLQKFILKSIDQNKNSVLLFIKRKEQQFSVVADL